jgi:hypothetical protein
VWRGSPIIFNRTVRTPSSLATDILDSIADTTMSLVIKVFFNDDIRRITVGQDVFTDLSALKARIAQVYGADAPTPFVLRYKDSDDDVILLTSDSDLREAVDTAVTNGVLRLYLGAAPARLAPTATTPSATAPTTSTATPQAGSRSRGCPYRPPPMPEDAGSAPVTHPGVVCDGCQGSIFGSRFKCTVCHDFDLCATCEGKGMHAKHDLARIRTPRARPCFQRPSGPPLSPMSSAPTDTRLTGCTREPSAAELMQNIGSLIPTVIQLIQPVAAEVMRTSSQFCSPAQQAAWSSCGRTRGCPRPCAQPQERDSQPDVTAEDWYEHVVAEQTAAPHATTSEAATQHERTHQEQVRQAQLQHDKARFGEQLAALHEMGFTDDEEMIALLHKYNGVVPRVVSDLFARKS